MLNTDDSSGCAARRDLIAILPWVKLPMIFPAFLFVRDCQ